MHKKTVALAIIIALIGAGLFAWSKRQPAMAPGQDDRASSARQAQPADRVTAFDKKRLSITDPASLWVIANKRSPLNPRDYAPETVSPAVPLTQAAGSENMRIGKAMQADFEAMFAAAKEQGIGLALASGYRSYATQVSVYGREVSNNGQANADKVSARPGYSEHQTGLAADVSPAGGDCVIEECFGTTKEGVWVRDNAWRYGFIIRYAADKTDVTGYSYEPWHIRYVGKDLAAEMQRTGVQTLEEFFSTGAAPDYR